MRDIMHRFMCVYVVGVLIVAISGCASHSILGSLSEDANHAFREVRWGFSQERVELAEAGNRVYERTENALVYRHKINGVDCLLIYTFKDNQLRTAGYVTVTPVMNAENIIEEAVDKYGMPTTVNNTEMMWKNSNTVIFANVYDSVKKVTQTKYQHTSGGLLRDVLQQNLAKRGEEGVIKYFDGVFAYVDRAFYDQLYEMEFPLSELSFYEKQLMGVIERGKRTIIPGLGTIPQGAIQQ
ncbi:hypothetical protein J4G07_12915 [Candidatus Poribacteria bacterium]|nr:hypothetical protein [Candidatus Poribacteria bacterium]